MPQIKQADATFIITKTPSKYITADIGKITIIADNVSLATFGRVAIFPDSINEYIKISVRGCSHQFKTSYETLN